MEKAQPNYYAIISANVRYDDRLKANEKLLYGEITALANKNGYCHASNKYFAKLYGVSEVSITNWINNLIKTGYVTREIIYKDGAKQILGRHLRIVCHPPQENLGTPPQENLGTPPQENLGTLYNIIYNNTSNNNTSNNTKEDTKVSKKSPEELTIPEDIPDKVKDVLCDWLEYKRDGKRKPPYKPIGWKNQIKLVRDALDKHGEEAVSQQISTAIANSWQGMNLQNIKSEPKQERKYTPEEQRLLNIAAGKGGLWG